MPTEYDADVVSQAYDGTYTNKIDSKDYYDLTIEEYLKSGYNEESVKRSNPISFIA